ncbi:MAG: hypothetical protein AABZ84_06315 [Pseudomonadota bacterium]
MKIRGYGWAVLCIALGGLNAAQAGMVVEVRDPRFFEQQQAVIFPKAEVKLVTFEFEAVGDDQRGKQRAKELHRQFLAKIHDLQGGAIITFVTPAGQKIENYRVQAERVAKEQHAQMVLWGRIMVDRAGTPLINARLMLIEPPPGISADYKKFAELDRNSFPVGVSGVIDAPVTQWRIDFNTVENDVTPLALYLSGLARYYKGAVRGGGEAARWLNGSIADFKAYVAALPETADRGALSQAHLYLARAYVRLADAAPARTAAHLDAARRHGELAAKLNPFDAAVPTVQAVIAARQGARLTELRSKLAQAVNMAPADGNARVNLAVLDSAQGKVGDALLQLDNANFVQEAQQKAALPAVDKLRRQLAPYADRVAPSSSAAPSR